MSYETSERTQYSKLNLDLDFDYEGGRASRAGYSGRVDLSDGGLSRDSLGLPSVSPARAYDALGRS